MEKNNNRKILYALMAFGISCTACTKNYESYNTNPYQATEKQMEADNFSVGREFAAMVNAVLPAGDTPGGTNFVNKYQIAFNLAGDVFSGYMGQAGDWGGNTNNLTYGFNLGWVNGQFNQTGELMASWQKIKQITDKSGDSLVMALANVIKVTGIIRATDSYGPIPFTDITTGTFTPKYDAQDKIYTSCFSELDRAIQTLWEMGPKGGKSMLKHDLIYGGDYLKWAKYANSLKLRMAMRMVYVDPSRARQLAEEAVAHPAGLITTITDGAEQKAVANALPLFNNPLATLSVQYKEARMGASMQSILEGYKDPRIGIYFKTATLPGMTNAYVGVRTGIEVTRTAYQPFSELNITERTPYPWLRNSEVLFLCAEGALRGWTMGGTAQQLYESGVRTAFEESRSAIPANYLTDASALPKAYVDPANSANNRPAVSSITVPWNEKDKFERKLERIITQKWIAMYPNGQEAWAEYRRTGYPRLFPVALNRSGGLVSTALQVRRLPYPTQQYQLNAANVTAATALLGGSDNGGTKLWWDKKP